MRSHAAASRCLLSLLVWPGLAAEQANAGRGVIMVVGATPHEGQNGPGPASPGSGRSLVSSGRKGEDNASRGWARWGREMNRLGKTGNRETWTKRAKRRGKEASARRNCARSLPTTSPGSPARLGRRRSGSDKGIGWDGQWRGGFGGGSWAVLTSGVGMAIIHFCARRRGRHLVNQLAPAFYLILSVSRLSNPVLCITNQARLTS